MVVVGVVLAAFFVGLSVWHHGQRPLFRAFLALGQFSGLVAAAALVMTGIYSGERLRRPMPSGSPCCSSLWRAPSGSSAGPRCGTGRCHEDSPTSPWLACAADLARIVVRRHWLEWLAVGLLLCFVAAVALGTWSTAPRRENADASG